MYEPDPSWDFLKPDSKERVTMALRDEFEGLWSLVVDPAHWSSPTACEGWDTRDMVGHLVDATSGYLDGFDAANRGETVDALAAESVAAAYDEAARSYRSVPRDELLDRFRADTDRLLASFDSLSAAEWVELVIPDRYAGPLPATALATGLLGGYTAHSWDLCEGRGQQHRIAADVADLLVPFVFALWSFTADTSTVDDAFSVGVRTSGRNGGEIRVDVSDRGVVCGPGSLEDCSAVLDVDPGTLVLVAYGRVDAGTVDGDRAALARFRSLLRSM